MDPLNKRLIDEEHPTDEYLDALYIKHFENISLILELSHLLDNSLKNGRFLLARARATGNSSVRVSPNSFNISDMEQYGSTAKLCEVKQTQNIIHDSFIPFTKVEVSDSLRPGKDDPKADPLRWFAGVLVPPALRQAQDHFRRAILLSAELASKRNLLEVSSQKIKNMVALRKKLDST